MKIRVALSGLLCAGVLISGTAQALSTPIVVNAFDRGYYVNTGEHFASAYNTFTGVTDEGFGRTHFSGLFAFDLSDVFEPIISAKLRLEVELYVGDSPSEGVSIFDVNTPIAPLLTEHGLGSAEGQVIFSDLGSGKLYGSFSVVRTDIGVILEIPLLPDAIADINNVIGEQFAVGLLSTTSSSTFIPHGVRFSGYPPGPWDSSNTKIAQLILLSESLAPVPEPGSLALLGLALGSLTISRRKCSKVA